MTVLVDEAADLAEFGRVDFDALAELGDFIILEAQFTSATNRAFRVGVAEVEDDVGVFVTLDGTNFLFDRAFIREERREQLVVVAIANAAPNGEQVRGVPISCDRMCQDDASY